MAISMMNLSKIKKAVRNPRKAYRYLQSKFTPFDPLEPAYLFLNSRYPIGTHVLERNWDVLIILDTCRFDALSHVADDYPFLSKNKIDRVWSLGGTSPEWIAHTFSDKYSDELSRTGYITANPHAKTALEDSRYKPQEHDSEAVRRFYRYGDWNTVEPNNLAYYDPLYSYYKEAGLKHDYEDYEVTPPRYVTDRAIATTRQKNLDRLILHYMQPHYPWVSNAIQEDRDIREYEKRPKRAKQFGKKIVFDAYLDEVRATLNELQILLNNIDAEKIVISADHGDAFGEWGVYGHNPGNFHPKVRNVPWALTSGVDKKTYNPQIQPKNVFTSSLTEQLEALGYR